MFKVNKKNPKTASLMSSQSSVFFVNFERNFTTFPNVCIVDLCVCLLRNSKLVPIRPQTLIDYHYVKKRWV